MIVKAINEWYENRPPDREFRISPSNMGDCRRKLAFLLEGKVKNQPLSSESKRVFDLGHQRGDALEAIAKELWPDAQTQVPVTVQVTSDIAMEGTADLWIPSIRTVVDFKTAGSFAMGKLPDEGPALNYRLQIHAYRHGLAVANNLAAEGISAFIVYEAKDSDARKGVRAGMLREYEVQFTQELEATFMDRIVDVADLLITKRDGTLDPLAINGLKKGSWQCRTNDAGVPLWCPIGPNAGRCHE